MKLKCALLSVFFLINCTGSGKDLVNAEYLESECEIAGLGSKQCQINELKDYTLDEKEALLGWLYMNGAESFSPNYEKAEFWLKKASENNNPEAFNSLGMMYFLGLGQAINYHQAEKYFLLANQYGEKKEAKVNLAELYRSSPAFGISLDFEKTKQWYILAESENPSRAYEGLSKLYLTQNNYKEVYNYASKAAVLGNQESQYNLGVLYEKGIYVKKDKKQAEYWYTQAAEQGHANAIHNLKGLKQE